MTTDNVSGFDVPPPTTPTSDGSSDRAALIRILHGCILSIDEMKAAQAADLCLAAGFTRAHGEPFGGFNARLYLLIKERDAAIRERDAARAERDAEKAEHHKTTCVLYESNQRMRALIAERDEARVERDSWRQGYMNVSNGGVTALAERDAAIARADAADAADAAEADAKKARGSRDDTFRAWQQSDKRAAALAEALEHLVSVINAAGLRNLVNGVQLGATVWYVKATAAMEHATKALAGNAATDGDRHVHFNVQAMNDDGDWETPLPPMMSLADARERALDIAEDYPRGVEIHRVVLASERVWTNAPLPAPPAPAAPVVTEATVEAACDAVVAQGPADVTWTDRNYLRWLVRTVSAALAAAQQAGTSQDRQISPSPTAAAVNPPGGDRRDG